MWMKYPDKQRERLTLEAEQEDSGTPLEGARFTAYCHIQQSVTMTVTKRRLVGCRKRGG